jgi:hypothetical protein
MVARIHKNEMIIPAQGGHADAMRAAMSGRGRGGAVAAIGGGFNMGDMHFHAAAGQPFDGKREMHSAMREVRRKGVFAGNRNR